MYQDLDEPVDVIATFEKGAIKPLRIRWKGRVHKIARVTGTWRSHKGEDRERHFACVDADDNVFQLTYNDRRTDWVIDKIWVE